MLLYARPRKGCGQLMHRETKPIILPPPYERNNVPNICCNKCKDITGIRFPYFLAPEGLCATCHYAVQPCTCYCDPRDKTTTYKLPLMLHAFGAHKQFPAQGSRPLAVDAKITDTDCTTSSMKRTLEAHAANYKPTIARQDEAPQPQPISPTPQFRSNMPESSIPTTRWQLTSLLRSSKHNQRVKKAQYTSIP